MSDLVDRVVTDVGIDRGIAERAVGIILDFLSKEGPADNVRSLLARLPDHQTLIATAESDGGILAGMGGIMGVGAKLMGCGLDVGQIQNVVRSLALYCSEKGGQAELEAIAAAIPGLRQFM